jgi:hypothetical protein
MKTKLFFFVILAVIAMTSCSTTEEESLKTGNQLQAGVNDTTMLVLEDTTFYVVKIQRDTIRREFPMKIVERQEKIACAASTIIDTTILARYKMILSYFGGCLKEIKINAFIPISTTEKENSVVFFTDMYCQKIELFSNNSVRFNTMVRIGMFAFRAEGFCDGKIIKMSLKPISRDEMGGMLSGELRINIITKDLSVMNISPFI